MALFFFELRDGFRVTDDEGQDFETLEDARDEAIKSARSMMREQILAGTLQLADSIRIRDANGEVLDTIYFRDAVEIAE